MAEKRIDKPKSYAVPIVFGILTFVGMFLRHNSAEGIYFQGQLYPGDTLSISGPATVTFMAFRPFVVGIEEENEQIPSSQGSNVSVTISQNKPETWKLLSDTSGVRYIITAPNLVTVTTTSWYATWATILSGIVTIVLTLCLIFS